MADSASDEKRQHYRSEAATKIAELPNGCQLHIAGPVEQRWRVITVWESADAFQRFRDEKLLPAVREAAGSDGPPGVEPEVNPVHKLITA